MSRPDPNTVRRARALTPNHPHVQADRIGDALVDAVLRDDPHNTVRATVWVGPQTVGVHGEYTATGALDPTPIVRRVIDAPRPSPASPEPRRVHASNWTRRSDPPSPSVPRFRWPPRPVFGYADRQTREHGPYGPRLARRLADRCPTLQHQPPHRVPPGPAILTLRLGYEQNRPVTVEGLYLRFFRPCSANPSRVRARLRSKLLEPTVPGPLVRTPAFPTIRFEAPPEPDPSVQWGRIRQRGADQTYGPHHPLGVGGLAGWGPTHPLRAGAYAARWLAKTLVAHHIVDRCTVRLGGPQGLGVHTDSASPDSPERLAYELRDRLGATIPDPRPPSPPRTPHPLQTRPTYEATARHGHIGIPAPNPRFPWEQVPAGPGGRIGPLRAVFRS